MGASATPATASGETFLFGALPEAVAAGRARRSSSSRRAKQSARPRSSSSRPGPRPWRRPNAPPTRPDRSRCGSSAGSASPTSITANSATWIAWSGSRSKQGLTVSLVLPALNEEETIGIIVERARRDLMERHQLVDELLVIDSDSTDRTREVAAGRGRPSGRPPAGPDSLRQLHRQGRGVVEEPVRDERRHRRLGRHRRPQLASPDGLRDRRPAHRRGADPVRQGLLPPPDRRGRRPEGGRRRTGHRAGRAAAPEPLLPGAVRPHPAAVRRVRRAAQPARDACRSSPATRSRSGI